MMANMDNSELEALYQCAEELSNAKFGIEKHEEKYRQIMDGVKGTPPAKRLASQFITRFFPKFPALASEALDRILDLCEDDDINIRKQAIKDLPSLCRDMKEFLPKIADVLSQLLQTDDQGELVVIQNSLMSILRKDAKGTLIGLFSQVRNGGDVVRERVLKFLFLKLKTEGVDLLGKEAETQFVKEIKSTLGDCTADEFHTFMTMLGMTNMPKTVSGQAQLADLIMTMAELDKPFNYGSSEDVDRLLQCGESALPYFSPQVKGTKFCEYICTKVSPHLQSIADQAAQARVLKLLAELAENVGMFDAPLDATQKIYNCLRDYMPLPPEDADGSTTIDTEFEFTKVECLLFAYHSVGRQSPEHLTDNAEVLKDFKARLQYFARAIIGYNKKLREFLANKSNAELQKEENKIKTVALRSTTNINVLIKDLFHIPPSYKAKVVLSWKPEKQAKPRKRKSISFESSPSNPKHPRQTSSSQQMYQPPTGKWSKGVGTYTETRGGGRRGGRGRGRGRYSY